MSHAELGRAAKALALAQKRLGTSFVLMVDAIPLADRPRHAGKVFIVDRTHRGAEDANAFSVVFNPDETTDMKWKDIRCAAGHEVIHMILWPLSELAEERGSKERRARAREANETATYTLMRCIFGEIGT